MRAAPERLFDWPRRFRDAASRRRRRARRPGRGRPGAGRRRRRGVPARARSFRDQARAMRVPQGGARDVDPPAHGG